MKLQITLNQFNALTLIEKFELFGKDLFTTKQFNVINAVIKCDLYGMKFLEVCDLLQVSKASLSRVIGSLKYCKVVYIHKTFNLNQFKNVRFSAKRLDCILYSHFIDLLTKSYVEATEETPVEATEEKIIEKAQCIATVNDQPLIQLESNLNPAVIGFTEDKASRIILIYSFETLINLLMNSLECDELEAVEYFDHNLMHESVFINYT